MRSANYIGRVGALAVALGVTSAVAQGGMGTAVADSTGDGASSQSASEPDEQNSRSDSTARSAPENTSSTDSAGAANTPQSATGPVHAAGTARESNSRPSPSDGRRGSATGADRPASDRGGVRSGGAAANSETESSAGSVANDGFDDSTQGAPPREPAMSPEKPVPAGGSTADGLPELEDGSIPGGTPSQNGGVPGSGPDLTAEVSPTKNAKSSRGENSGRGTASGLDDTPRNVNPTSSTSAIGDAVGPTIKPPTSVTLDSAITGKVSASATDTVPGIATTPVQTTALTVPAASKPVDPVRVLVKVIGRVMSALAPAPGFGVAGTGTSPIDAPIAWMTLAFARRQIGGDHTTTMPTVTTAATAAAAPNQVTAVAGPQAAVAAVNQAPSFNPTILGYGVDKGVVYTYGLLNGSDPEGGTLTYSVPTTGAGAAQHGVVYTDNAYFSHVATRGYTGLDTFTISVSDGVNTVARQIAVSVPSATAPPNGAPVASPGNPFTIDPTQPGDYPGTVRGHLNVTDPNLDPLTYAGTGDVTKGYVQVDSATGSFVYVPTTVARHAAAATNAAATGANRDTFSVTVSDGRGGVLAVPVTVAISPMNTAPNLYGTPTVLPPNANGTVTGSIYAWDNEGDTLSYTVVTAPIKGQVAIGPSGSFTYVPTATARQEAAATPGVDQDAFVVRIADGYGGATTVAVSGVTIAPAVSGPLPTPTVTQHTTVGSFPIDVTVSADGKRVYVVNFNSSTISVLDSATGAQIGNPIPVGVYPVSVTLNPSGTSAYVSSSYLETVDIINVAAGAVTGGFNVGRHPGAISFSPDGSKMYVLNFSTGVLAAYNPVTNTVINSVAVGNRPIRMSLSTDGTRAYVLNGTDNTVSVVNTTTMSVVGSPIVVGKGDNFSDIAVAPDGTKAYVTNGVDGTVTVIDTATRTVRTVVVGAQPTGVAVSPDGSMVYVANGYSNTVSIISTATNTVVGTIALGAGNYAPVSVTFSPDGTKAFVARNGYGSTTNGDVVTINTGSVARNV